MPVGPTELIIVLVIVLIIFGAGKLTDVGTALGKTIRGFKEATNEEQEDPTQKKRHDDESPKGKEDRTQD